MTVSSAVKKEVTDFRNRLKQYNYSSQVVGYYPVELVKFFEYAGVPPDNADAEYMVKYRDHLQKIGLKKGTVNKKLAAVRTWYKFKFDENPADEKWKERMIISRSIKDNRRGTGQDSGFKPIPIDWLRKLVSAAEKMSTPENCEFECFIKLLVFTGGRAQFYGIQWSNIDFDNDMIRLLVKGRKLHELPMVDTLKEVLLRHYDNSGEKDTFVFKYGRATYVDGKPKETVMNQRANLKNAERIVDRVAQSAGLTKYNADGKLVKGERITPHRLRKTLAHEGGELGLSLETVHDILGHSNILVTKQTYRGRQYGKARRELEAVDLLGRGNNSRVDLSSLTKKQKEEILRELLSDV